MRQEEGVDSKLAASTLLVQNRLFCVCLTLPLELAQFATHSGTVRLNKSSWLDPLPLKQPWLNRNANLVEQHQHHQQQQSSKCQGTTQRCPVLVAQPIAPPGL